MSLIFKAIILIVGVPIALIAVYIAYLWLTYIDVSVEEGEAYGVSIGSTKEQTYSDALLQFSRHSDLSVYIRHGPKAGDNFTVVANISALEEIKEYDTWTFLLDGKGEYFNSLKLRFKDDSLIDIHRHRKNFELP